MENIQSNQSLQDYLDQQEEVTKDHFQIDTDEKANWALRKIKQYQKQKKENNALAEAEIEKINAWADSENDKAQQSIDYFQGLLSAYALSKREENPKFKKLELPNGKIKFTKQQPKWNYDESLLLESLKQSERKEFIKVKETPDKSAIKKKFGVQGNNVIDPETGEIIEGVTVEEREDAFKVEVSE